jgi:hypothetical protein
VHTTNPLGACGFQSADDFAASLFFSLCSSDTTRDHQLAADLCRAWGAFYLKWLQRSRDHYIESESLATLSTAAETPQDQLVAADLAAASGSTSSAAPVKDELGATDPSTSLSSLPASELAELKRLQRLDRERERHFENAVEEEADEEEDELFGDMSKARKIKSQEQMEREANNPVDRTLPSSLTKEEHEAVTEELKKNTEEDVMTTGASDSASSASSAASAASATSASSSSAPLFIEFKSLSLPPSPRCVLATSFVAARSLFKLSLEWFTRASMFYILDGYVSDHIPIQQDISLLYKLLAVFDMDLSRQCKMHKRRIDLLTPIYKQLSVASYQEFFQQLTDELATTYSDMMELKQFILQMKVRLLGKKFSEKKRDDAQQKVNELALNAIQFYQIWLQSWSKDGKEVDTLDEYYHRWYLMAMFKIARWSLDGADVRDNEQYRCAACRLITLLLSSRRLSSYLSSYSKIYHSDPQVLNQFIKKSLDQYRAVVAKALTWNAVGVMPEELELCKQMIELLPHKLDRVVAKGSFRV